jgi:hypothetical protein
VAPLLPVAASYLRIVFCETNCARSQQDYIEMMAGDSADDKDSRNTAGPPLVPDRESIAQWVMSRDVLVFMVPTVNTNGLLHRSNITLRHYARHLDGLVLQGAGTGCVLAGGARDQAVARWIGMTRHRCR